MASRPQLATCGLSGLSQSTSANELQSPSQQQRGDATRNLYKTIRPLPTQHYWTFYLDRRSKQQLKPGPAIGGADDAHLEPLDFQIESVQGFWQVKNQVDQIEDCRSVHLFKKGFKPVWEDMRNKSGGSWYFRVSKEQGPAIWTLVQLLAIGEKLQSELDKNDQLCGVGLSVHPDVHVITIWHRDSSRVRSILGILCCVLEEAPDEVRAELKPGKKVLEEMLAELRRETQSEEASLQKVYAELRSETETEEEGRQRKGCYYVRHGDPAARSKLQAFLGTRDAADQAKPEADRQPASVAKPPSVAMT